MKIADLPCPNCGSQLTIDAERKNTSCQFCHSSFALDDEAQHIKFDDLTQAGYEFEKGRQQAQSEKKPSAVKIAVIVIAALALAGGGIFIATSNSGGSGDDPVKVESLVKDSNLVLFIENYNDISKEPITSVEKGSSTSQCFAESYGYDLELSYASGEITVGINQTNATSNAGVSGMRSVFHDVVKTLDSSLDDSEIYALFDSSVSNPPKVRRNHKLGGVTINYFPDEQRGMDTVRGHLTLKAPWPAG